MADGAFTVVLLRGGILEDQPEAWIADGVSDPVGYGCLPVMGGQAAGLPILDKGQVIRRIVFQGHGHGRGGRRQRGVVNGLHGVDIGPVGHVIICVGGGGDQFRVDLDVVAEDIEALHRPFRRVGIFGNKQRMFVQPVPVRRGVNHGDAQWRSLRRLGGSGFHIGLDVPVVIDPVIVGHAGPESPKEKQVSESGHGGSGVAAQGEVVVGGAGDHSLVADPERGGAGDPIGCVERDIVPNICRGCGRLGVNDRGRREIFFLAGPDLQGVGGAGRVGKVFDVLDLHACVGRQRGFGQFHGHRVAGRGASANRGVVAAAVVVQPAGFSGRAGSRDPGQHDIYVVLDLGLEVDDAADILGDAGAGQSCRVDVAAEVVHDEQSRALGPQGLRREGELEVKTLSVRQRDGQARRLQAEVRFRLVGQENSTGRDHQGRGHGAAVVGDGKLRRGGIQLFDLAEIMSCRLEDELRGPAAGDC